MSGIFSCFLEPWNEGGPPRARGHGCPCCAREYDSLTAEDLDEHIWKLFLDLEEAVNIRARLGKGKPAREIAPGLIEMDFGRGPLLFSPGEDASEGPVIEAE